MKSHALPVYKKNRIASLLWIFETTVHTCTAIMFAWVGWGELYHYSVFALLEFIRMCIFHFSIASNGSPIQNLVHTNS